jgi:hypothetical protein
MMEVGVVIDQNNEPIFWHLPEHRTGGSLPDSGALWRVLWENRKVLSGFAHSHPGSGVPGPSYTDVTTFAAVEVALGVRLNWWITSETHLIVARWAGPDRLQYEGALLSEEPPWANELREKSGQMLKSST